MADELNEIKKLLKDKRLVIGTADTIKKLKENKISKVWISSNTPSGVRDDINRYASLNGVETIGLNVPNDELGVLCKKQFSVSVVSLGKGEK